MKAKAIDLVSGRLGGVSGRLGSSSRAGGRQPSSYGTGRLGVRTADAEPAVVKLLSPLREVPPRAAAEPSPRIVQDLLEPMPPSTSAFGADAQRRRLYKLLAAGALAGGLALSLIWTMGRLWSGDGGPKRAAAAPPQSAVIAASAAPVQDPASTTSQAGLEPEVIEERVLPAPAADDGPDLTAGTPEPSEASPAAMNARSARTDPPETAASVSVQPSQPQVRPSAGLSPAAPSGPPPDPGRFRLTSIMNMPDKTVACINGQSVTVGQTVDGAKVVEIGDYYVELDYNGHRFQVIFGENNNPPPSAAPQTDQDSQDGKPKQGDSAGADKPADGN